MTALTIVGLILQLVGASIAFYSLVGDFREYAEGRSFWPWWSRLWARVGRLYGRKQVQHRHGRVDLDSSIGSVSGVMEPAVVPGETDPLDVQVHYLRQVVDRLAAELGATRGDLTGVRNELHSSVGDLGGDIAKVRTDLTGKLNAFATGRVGAELFGLVLVAIGTIFGSVASLI